MFVGEGGDTTLAEGQSGQWRYLRAGGPRKNWYWKVGDPK